MKAPPKTDKPAEAAAEDRKARLAAALRANLRRRKVAGGGGAAQRAEKTTP
jgi:hypothetical protein